MNDRLEIPFNNKKSIFLLVGAAIFVSMGIWMALDPTEFTRNGFMGIRDPRFIRVVAVFAIVFFGAAGFVGGKKMFAKKPGLIIDSTGITDNTNASSIGFIPWEDVAEIRHLSVLSNKFLLIILKDPQKYISKAKSRFKSKLMSANLKQYETPVTISTGALKSKHLELFEQVVVAHKKYGV